MSRCRLLVAVAGFVPCLALAQSPTITIRAGTVLDGRGGVVRNTTIVVSGSRIVRLDSALTTTYDLHKLTVMPGAIAPGVPYRHSHTTGTRYGSNTRSDVRMVSPSSRACTIRRRSKGSPWCNGRSRSRSP